MSYRSRHIKPKIKGLFRKKFFQRKLFWVFLLAFMLIAATAYFILFFSKIQVENIEVSGSEKIASSEIESIAWHRVNRRLFNTGIVNILSKSIFLVNKEDVMQDILKRFPAIKAVAVEKKFPNGMVVKVTERKPFAVFCRGTEFGECYVIDDSGVIFEAMKGPIEDAMIIRELAHDKEIFVGEDIIDANIMDMIAKVEKSLKNNFQIEVKEAFVSNPLIFRTSEQWKIYFDLESDIDMQIIKMNAILRDEIPASTRKNLQYIYLQYKDRAYYK
ncbi:MAG: hypothetical protein A3A98_03505 [Candidatus Staskawiczbacteria bacterium RIFCSPLOWO2_01_FULL_40_39]|uniref:POTRA domain-containing protein n=1 Tax=Candidatus Staskawiczbacteria bacterium RIFCSPHIGHO2_01_FULL_39_25 TaxID=1802202 RepID=A0A1G2HQ85_9BACT|nr:MAG: hypothetical protein A2730_02780 [Candidatus Staskawiczbacteria bacterium RIFCSPHIGHO2_01_FULL_39_25]OGZ72880.1 MAG: hypothetical protein A3A98_03505 [Candidatus Staskawiczbacteria bacterium RIFCSPLOWO2_01_FULL_40_39]OGZ75196.1 MAG: hypothetical protein A3I87_00780 [Candidatus Staskawiczbacteria bacterium RIFCSPLOWO2_02_FULL_39_8]